MARQTNNSRAGFHAIDLPQELQLEGTPASLPVYRKGSNYFKKNILGSRLRDNLVHLIPVVVLLCLFILWWFSHPETVNLETKNERIIVVEKEDMPELVNVTDAHFASIKSIFSTPYPLVPYVQISKKGRRAKRAVSTE